MKLSFYPLFTAFEFRLVDGENNTPTWNLKKLELISNKTICGREKWTAMYQNNNLGWAYDSMNTDVAHELTLRLTFGDDDVRELDLKQNGQWIQYPRGKKGVFNILVKNKSMSFTYSCQAIDLAHEDATNKITW